MIAKRAEYVIIQQTMTRVRLILFLFLLSLVCSLALFLPGCFKDPRQLVQGEWQEINKLGYVDVTDSTARWSSRAYKGSFQYSWVQSDDEPYTVEVRRNKEKWLAGITFEDDDHASVQFYIMEKLPPEAREFIRQKNRARNRPEDELLLRFRRVTREK